MAVPRNFWSRVRPWALVAAGFVFSLLSCGREVTGPPGGMRASHPIAFLAEFPGPLANVAEGAGSVVAFDRIRVVLRGADGQVAAERVVAFGAGVDSVLLDLSVPVPSDAPASGAPFALTLAYINAAGDTVFRGGPVTVQAIPIGRGTPVPAPVPVPLVYTGPGAQAVGVAILPETLTVEAGAAFAFTATARDAQQGVVVDAPVVFTSLDTTRARLASPAAGTGTARATRGIVPIQAELAAGGARDTAYLVITPRPAFLVVESGGAQTAPAGAALSDSVRVRLLATDGLGIAGAAIGLAVTTGGGSVTPASVTTDATGRAAFAWTLGPLVGAQAVTASAAGVADLVVTATAGEAPLVATQLAIVQQPAAQQVLGQPVAPAMRVEARDAAGVPVPAFTGMVTVALGANPGGATLGGTTSVAAVGGVATFDAVTVSALGDGYTLVASADGLADATSDPFEVGAGGPAAVLLVSGGDQTGYVSQPLAAPVVVRVTDAIGTPLEGITVTFAVTAGGGALTGADQVTDAAGEATLGGWTLGATPGSNTITATVAGVTPLVISATGELPPPTIQLSVFGSNVVGVERAGTLTVRLLQPAPAGGLTVSVVSNDPQFLAIAAPGTVGFAAGQTLGSIAVSGIALGNATVVATAPGYTPDTLVVPVSLNLISLPPTLNVPLAQTRSLPVQLSSPAPAGGVAVAVTSSDPSVARPVADTVLIPAGAQSANATIEGLALGSATLVATNPNYALDDAVASVTAELNFTTTSVAPNGSFGAPVTVRLESGGAPVAAPAGGVPLTLSSDNAACATLPANATIGAGLVSVTLDVTYGGSAALPCTTRLRVTGPAGFAVDSVTANVAAVPTFTRAASTLGSGLQRNLGATLTASNHGGVTVRVTSLDSSIVLVSPSTATAGTGSYDAAVLPGATSVPLVVSSVAGRIADTVRVRLEAPGFTTHEFSVYVWQPVLQLSGFPTAMTTLATDDPFHVSIGTPQTFGGTSIWNADAVRTGGSPLAVTIVNDSIGVGTLVTSGGTADSITVFIAPGASNSPTSVAAGGSAFRPIRTGSASVRASIPGFRALATATGTVVVSQPAITLATDYIGSGLQRSRTVSTTGSPAPAGGTTITLAADRLGVVRFAPNASTPGVDTLQVTIPEGGTSATFYVQGQDGIVADTVTVTASAPGYTSGSAQQRVWAAVYQLNGLNGTGTPLTADDPFYVSIGTPVSPTGTSIWSSDPRRAGAAPFEVSVVSSAPATGILLTPAGSTVDSTTVSIAPQASNSPTSVAAGGVAMRYLAAGTTTVRATIPGAGAGARALAAATQTVTVNATAISLSTDYIGSGLQRSRTVSLSAPAPAGGVPVTIHADRPGVVQFAPNATTLGVDTLVVTIAQGATTASFFVQGVEGIVADTVTLTASSPGYATGTAEQRVWQGVVELSGLGSSPNTLAPDDPFQVLVGTPVSPTGTTIWAADNIRFGASPLVATVSSSVATVGQLVTDASVGDTVTVQLVAGTRASPSTVAAGGVAFQVLTTGSTVVRATIPGFRSVSTAAGQTVAISAPAISLGTPQTLGSGLQASTSGSLSAAQHGGVNVVVRSANPALVRVAPSAGVEATDSIVIALANGSTGFSYVVAAQDGVTGQTSITASAAGFTDATATATVVAPAIQLSGLVTSRSAFGADDAFQAQVGVPVANGTSLSYAQARRAGGDPLLVTVSSAAAAVGGLVTTAGVDDTVVVAIAGGASVSPSTVAAGGVAMRYLSPGSTTVRVTHPTIASTTSSGTATVTVTTPTITLGTIPTVGAGLQASASGSLSGGQHGGLDVVVRSLDPMRALVARNATEAASASITITVPDGSTSFSYVVAGVEGTTGTATIEASAPAFTGAQGTATVVTPMLDLSGLVTSRAAGGSDDPFLVRIGLPNGTGTALSTTQAVRAGVAPLEVTVTSSVPAVGTLVTTPLTAGSVTVQIAPGASASPSTVATGGVAFRYLTAGTSVVQVSHPTIPAASTNGTVTVTVTP